MKYKRLAEVAEVLGCAVYDMPLRKFCVDSRKVGIDDLFFCLRGEKVDGHSFLKEVAAKGAAGAVVDKYYVGPTFGLQLLRVPDVLEALHKLAREIQSRRKSLIVGVTGSVGKTSTKEFISTLLEGKYHVAKTPGNANSQIGVPLSILNVEGTEEVFVVEMGMNHPGEIQKLVSIAPPDIAVLTKIGHAHVGNFSDGQLGIAREKSDIFSHPQTKVAIIPHEALTFKEVREKGKCTKITFGCFPGVADMVLKKGYVLDEWGKESPCFELPFEESHFLENFAAAVSVARTLRLSWEEIFKQLKHLKGFELRFEKKEQSGVLFVNDCYNASPEAVSAALKNLPSPGMGGKTVFVFGEMPELGSFSEEAHRSVAVEALEKVDHFLLFGKACLPMLDVFSTAGRPAEFFTDLRKLKQTMIDLAKPGDVVLIKGKNTNGLWQLLEV